LEGVIGPLSAEVVLRDVFQLAINLRQKLVEGTLVSGADLLEQLCDFSGLSHACAGPLRGSIRRTA
jgi:hypothetical protein